MNSLDVSQQPLLTDSSVVTKAVVTADLPVRLLQPVSVLMVMALVLFTRLTPDLKDPDIGAGLAVVSLVADHGSPVEVFEATAGAEISDNLQVDVLDMTQQGLLELAGELTFVTFRISTFS